MSGDPGDAPDVHPQGWQLWGQPPALVRYFLATETVAVVLTGYLAVMTHAAGHQWWQFSVLTGMALLQTEASRNIEKARRRNADTPHVNLTSVWVFAGAVLLPAALTGTLVVVIYLHLWVRIWRTMGTRPPYRVLFSTAVMVLSAYAASAVMAVQPIIGWTGPTATAATVIAGMLVCLAINAALVGIAVALHRRPGHGRVSLADCALEIATLSMGAFAALALSQSPFTVVLIMPPLLVLYRAVLVRQLEELVVTDQKTGLLNVPAWHDRARRELARAQRHGSSFGVLMMDLDHFKRVNDTYGHLAGDEVLKAIARLLVNEIREYDSAGRFGGEEFAVLVADSPAPAVVATAERLRRKITQLEIIAPTGTGTCTIAGLSASIGVAVYPGSGTTVEKLLLAADSAVYTAKSKGRNQVIVLSP